MDLLGLNDAVWLAIFTNAIAALAFYVSYASGTFNVSQPGFMAIGAYAAALGTTRDGLSLVTGLAAGFVVITVIALVLALVTLRLTGIHLAMATLAFAVVVQQLIVIIPSLGGSVGIFAIPNLVTWWWGIGVLALVALLVRALLRSRLGYEMRTMREDHIFARASGVDMRRVRLTVAVLSAWIAGVAGAVSALQSSFVGPSDFGFSLLILILSYAIVGGTDRWWGPILGALVLTILPELTRDIERWREVVSGALIVLVVLAFPEGIAGVLSRLARPLRRWARPATRRAPESNAVPAIEGRRAR